MTPTNPTIDRPPAFLVHKAYHVPGTCGVWATEAIADERGGECYWASFTGMDAEERAKEYAEWMTSRKIPQPD